MFISEWDAFWLEGVEVYGFGEGGGGWGGGGGAQELGK